MFGKSIISNANETKDNDADAEKVNIEWPEDVVAKAKIIRINAQTMISYVEAVSNSFITGWFFGMAISDCNHFVGIPSYIYEVG